MDKSRQSASLWPARRGAGAGTWSGRLRTALRVGAVALAAALHFDLSTPNFMIQEAFAEFDVPWRNSLVGGWNPLRGGEFVLADAPGLGLDLDEAAIAAHPYVRNAFPSLWDGEWLTNFTQTDR